MEARPVQPDEPDSPPAPASLRDSNLMRSVNNNLRQRSEALPAAEPIAFFCECGSPTCYAPIWMTVASFDARVEDRPGWLLHTGHEPSALWHPREPVPTRTSRRAGSAAADPDLAMAPVRSVQTGGTDFSEKPTRRRCDGYRSR